MYGRGHNCLDSFRWWKEGSIRHVKNVSRHCKTETNERTTIVTTLDGQLLCLFITQDHCKCSGRLSTLQSMVVSAGFLKTTNINIKYYLSYLSISGTYIAGMILSWPSTGIGKKAACCNVTSETWSWSRYVLSQAGAESFRLSRSYYSISIET
jgi:hypothetical protein